jgi:two-component system sensor histidine kinase PilS (NtrC family)
LRIPTPRTNAILEGQILHPRRLVRLGYLCRLSVATAILVAAVSVWGWVPNDATLVAALAFAGAAVFTAGSAAYTEMAGRRATTAFVVVQMLFDFALVTAVVHVTGRRDSGFSALYILVIANAAILLPRGGSVIAALLGCVFYVGDATLFGGGAPTAELVLRFTLFAAVAAAAATVGGRLREVRDGRAELAVELHQARFQAADILSNIRSGIITIDSGRRLRYANPAASALLGLDLDARIGHPVMDEVQAIAPTLGAALERAAETGERTSRAEGVATIGGRRFPIGVTTTFADGSSAVAGWSTTAIFQDISGQKQLDSLNMRAQRLEAVAELSASLAHEIKNPLASIRSAVEQLARMPHADDDGRTLAGLIVRESDRLDRLLIEFLDFARVRATRTALVDLGAIARGAAGLVAQHPDRRSDVEVVCSTPEVPLVIEGDEDLLHRAVFNLALNAVQALPRAGRVVVEVAPVAVDQLPAGLAAFERGGVALRVTDTGAGIAPEIREILFDPFVTTKPGGSGLGLPIVHRAVEAHAGVVLVDSSAGGTRFTILLPPAPPNSGDPA